MLPPAPATCPHLHEPSAADAATRAHEAGRALTVMLADLRTTVPDEARSFLLVLAEEGAGDAPGRMSRWLEVEDHLRQGGDYQKDFEELTLAARIAWRNSIRCIGRQHWRSLAVRDERRLAEPEAIFASIVEHLRLATNGGTIKPLMTVFTRDVCGPHPVRILNHQILRYAGYRSRGHCLGDPANVELTELALSEGWRPPATRTPFDLLPVIISDAQGKLHLHELPEDPEVVREVRITHPHLPWFEALNLKWHAVPAISDMVLDAGGLKYPATIFNGWYMGTEIACRNLGDAQRYDLLPVIAERMGLDRRSERSLWKDRALLELNTAVLHSFEQEGVRMVDHHTASRQFMDFSSREQREGREAFGDWSWLVPPLSGSTSPIFHRSFAEHVLKPGLFYLEKTPR